MEIMYSRQNNWVATSVLAKRGQYYSESFNPSASYAFDFPGDRNPALVLSVNGSKMSVSGEGEAV